MGKSKGKEEQPLQPAECPPDEPHLFFQRGTRYPRAIAWLGFSSFWGHLWHLAASVIATEDIDARDWMHADEPDTLTKEISRVLGGADLGQSLTEKLDQDLWIDFIADCGDDADVSGAVASMLFRAYRVPLPGSKTGEHITAPRGDILLFGGDTAYPVATDIEIHNRVCLPFNQVLRTTSDDRTRVLLGLPGNHDWYDGLDGFARIFRVRRGSVNRLSVEEGDTETDRSGAIGHLIDWVEAFRVGHFVAKRTALPLIGYQPVQNASYFMVKLAPKLDLWAVDRQLRAVDYTQRSYFGKVRAEAPDNGLVVCIADPAYAMLEPNAKGQATLSSVEISIEDDEPLVLSGDTHHFCRQEIGACTHLVAGGGGAFLHPARIDRWGDVPKPEAEFPGPRASFALAMQVPWQIAGGRAGFLVHTVIGALYLPLAAVQASGHSSLSGAIIVAALATVACGMLGGWRQGRPLAIGLLATLCGIWIGAMPHCIDMLLAWQLDAHLSPGSRGLVAALLGIYPGTLGFGTYLMVLTLLGLERHQAFSALAHPGYKHFVRLRVRKDGSAIDTWVFGKVDTLDKNEKVVLVDNFTWNNPRYEDPAPQ